MFVPKRTCGRYMDLGSGRGSRICLFDGVIPCKVTDIRDGCIFTKRVCRKHSASTAHDYAYQESFRAYVQVKGEGSSTSTGTEQMWEVEEGPVPESVLDELEALGLDAKEELPGASGLVGASVGARLASPKNIALKIDFPIISVDDGGRARAKSAYASGV